MKPAAVATLAACALLAAVRHADAACPPSSAAGALLSHGAVQLAWRAEPPVLQVGQPFALHVVLCPPHARLLRVDARMPEHRHGMNYRPTLTHQGGGQWQAQGLLWHMSGRWELSLEVQTAEGGVQRLVQSVTLP